MRSLLGLSLLFVVFAAVPAQAQGTPQQRAACSDDAIRLCDGSQSPPDVVERCMKAHVKDLSPACRREFTAGGKRRRR